MLQVKLKNITILDRKLVFDETCLEDETDLIQVWCVYVKNNTLYTSADLLMSKRDVEQADNFYYLNDGNGSTYALLYGDKTVFNIVRGTKSRRSCNTYTYSNIPRLYSLKDHDNMDNMQKQLMYINPITPLVPMNHTFGIEFETASGVIPEDVCLKHGLIPLRDGSIGGIEYTTLPMTIQQLPLLKKQIEVLKEYCTFDKTCSMHIHMGNYVQNLKYIYCVAKVFYLIQDELEAILPKNTFHTELYKSNCKSYCRKLPDFSSISEFYYWLSDGMSLNEELKSRTLTTPHPSDPAGLRKWNIYPRYFAANFVNAVFYEQCKTIEFRFLKPSFNYDYICNWLFIFDAILRYAKKLYSLVGSNATFAEASRIINENTKNKSLKLLDMLYIVHQNNPKVYRNCNIAEDFVWNLQKITKIQKLCGDNIGMLTSLHSCFIKNNPYEQS